MIDDEARYIIKIGELETSGIVFSDIFYYLHEVRKAMEQGTEVTIKKQEKQQ